VNPKIKARVRLENGKLAIKANQSRLIVRGTKDVSDTVRGYGFNSSYREMYVVMQEPEGFIWREVTHGMGINGHHRTLQEMVRTTACQGYEIELLPEPVNSELLAEVRRNAERYFINSMDARELPEASQEGMEFPVCTEGEKGEF
jgi:hypothetical protein